MPWIKCQLPNWQLLSKRQSGEIRRAPEQTNESNRAESGVRTPDNRCPTRRCVAACVMSFLARAATRSGRARRTSMVDSEGSNWPSASASAALRILRR